MNKVAAEFLKRRRFEISKDMGREYDPLTIRDMAQMCDINEFTLGRLEKGRGTPSTDNMPKLAAVYGAEVYKVYGQKPPMPADIDPDFIELATSDDPNMKALYQLAMNHARAYKERRELPKEIVRNLQVTS
jgi:DNA-binding XRE family transcriptional regulator